VEAIHNHMRAPNYSGTWSTEKRQWLNAALNELGKPAQRALSSQLINAAFQPALLYSQQRSGASREISARLPHRSKH